MAVARSTRTPSRLRVPPRTRSPAGAGDGQGLAGDGGFVYGAAAGDDLAVEWNAVAGEDAKDVAYGYGVERQQGLAGAEEGFGVCRGGVCEPAGFFNFEPGEAAEVAHGAVTGAGLQPAASEQEGEDENDGLVVDVAEHCERMTECVGDR